MLQEHNTGEYRNFNLPCREMNGLELEQKFELTLSSRLNPNTANSTKMFKIYITSQSIYFMKNIIMKKNTVTELHFPFFSNRLF